MMMTSEQRVPPLAAAQRLPRSEATSAPRWARFHRRLDFLLVGSVLLLAFLASSFIARNSDVWLHLVSGKLLAQGRLPFGVDPFAYATEPASRIPPTWLFDLLLYGLFDRIGGAGLVLVKALLITALAALLLRMRRADGGKGLPAVCTVLAILAMSPGLLLRPSCFSLFFLAGTLWLLWQPHGEEDVALAAPRAGCCAGIRCAGLLLLFLAWVNLDSGFLLGLLLVGLFWAGEQLAVRTRMVSSRHTPTWLLPVVLATCLLNPHHWHAFHLPAELSLVPVASALQQTDPLTSPWQLGLQPLREINLAVWAYFVLTGLSLLSFALVRRNLHAWRLLVWGGFALLGAWQMRFVPYFAVVATPITVLNLQDYLSRRRTVSVGERGGHGSGAVLGRLGLLAGNLLLVLLAWPGWLQGFHEDARRVSWGVRPDPSWQRVTETIRRWRQQGRLGGDDRAFMFPPGVAYYGAWCWAEEKIAVNQFLPLSPQEARAYEEVCRSLSLTPEEAGSAKTASGSVVPSEHWQKVFREWGITYLVLDDPELFIRLVRDSRHWFLLHVDGRAAIFGWREEGGGTHPSAAAPLDANRLAFVEESNEEGLELPPVPGQDPGEVSAAPDLWSRFRKASRAPALESEASAQYLRYFRARVLPRHQQREVRHWAAYAAGLTGMPPSLAVPPTAVIPLLVRLHHPPLFLGDMDSDLPAPLLLTVRLARSALAVNPEDAAAYLHLGQAYLALLHLTERRAASETLPLLTELRYVQIAATLKQALALNPDLRSAHQLLANLFTERGYLDEALHHRREELRLARRAVPQHPAEASAFEQQLRKLDQQVGELEQAVENGWKAQAIASRTSTTPDLLADAVTALRLGLARQTLDEVLLSAPPLQLGSRGAQLTFQLALQLGAAEQIRRQLLAAGSREHKHNLGFLDIRAPQLPGYAPAYHLPAYDWLTLLATAALGDYDRAEGQLQEMLAQLRTQHARCLQTAQQRFPLALTAEIGLSVSPLPILASLARRMEREDGMQFQQLARFLESELADLNVLGGMLALERGLPRRAENYFTAAVQPKRRGAPTGDAFAGRWLAEKYLRQIQEAARQEWIASKCLAR
jgi:hypothetical protein